MAGTITNVLQVLFQSKGADKVEHDTEKVGRAQNRLGQQSANNSRQFSAQASGLGGLVAAYAGAAATVFAITEAFNALNKAAQAENIVRGTNTLAAEIGQSGPKILASIKEITQGQLTLAESSENVNIALSAGFNNEQIEGLTEIATKASRALGRDLTESIQRVTRGAAKLEPELLDEIGIFTRIDPAVRAYANSLNVTESSLTNFERRQAFVNAVIEEGNKKFSAIDTSIPSAQKSLEQLRAQVIQLGTEFFQLANKVLAPIVSFFNKDFGNVILLFGGIMALVFGKTLTIVKDFVSTGINKMGAFAGKLASISEIVKGSFQEITKAVEATNEAVTARGGLSGSIDKVGRELAGTGNFATQLTGKGSRELASEASAARKRFLAGGAEIGKERDADIKTFQIAVDNLTKSGKTNTLAYRDASAMLKVYESAATKAGLSTKILTGLSVGLGRAARWAAISFNFLNIALGVITTLITVAQLIGQIFGVDLLQKFRESIQKTSEEVESLNSGLLGLTSLAEGDLTDKLKRAGASTKDLEVANKKLLEIYKELNIQELLVGKTRKEIIKSVEEEDNVIKRLISRIGLYAGAQTGKTMLDRLSEQQTEKSIKVLTAEQRAKIKVGAIEEKLVNLRTRLAKTDVSDTTTLQNLQQQIILLEAVRDSLNKYGDSLGLVIGQLGLMSGIDFRDVAESLTNVGGAIKEVEIKSVDAASGTEKTVKALSFFGAILKPLEDGSFSLAKASDDTKKLADASLRFETAQQKANDEFNRGATDSERLSQKLVGMKAAYEEALKSVGKTPDEMAKAAKAIEELRKKITDLKAAEGVLKGIRQALGSALKAVETTPFSGLIDATGAIAQNSEQLKGNQTAYLARLIETTEASAEQVRNAKEGQEINAQITKDAELNVTARKALVGLSLQVLQNTIKIRDQEEKRLKTLERQLELIKAQNALNLQNARNTLDATAGNFVATNMEDALNFNKASLELDKQRASNQAREIERSNELLEIQKEIAIVRASGSNAAQAKAAVDAAKAGLARQRASRAVVLLERDATVSNKELIEARKAAILLEQKLAEQEYNNRIAIIKSQGSVDKLRAEAEQEKLDNRIAVINKELEGYDERIAKELKLFDDETKLEQFKQRNAKTTLENQLKIIDLQTEVNKTKIDADREAAEAAANNTIKQLKGFKTMAESVKTLKGGMKLFAESVLTFARVQDPNFDTTDLKKAINNLPETIITNIDETIKAAEAARNAQNKIFSEQATSLDAIAILQKANINLQLEGINRQIKSYDDLRGVQRETLNESLKEKKADLEHQIKMLGQQKELAKAQAAAGGTNIAAQLEEAQLQYQAVSEALAANLQDLAFETDNLGNALLSLKDTMRSALTSEIVKLNEAIFDSDSNKSFIERVRDGIGEVFKAMQTDFFTKTVAEPLSKFLTDTLFSFFPGTDTKTGIEHAKVTRGSLHVTVDNMIPGITSDDDPQKEKEPTSFFGNILDKLKTMISKIFGDDGVISKTLGKVFGEGGTLTDLLSGVFGKGGFFSNILQGVFGQGGLLSGLMGGLGNIGSGIGGFFSTILSTIFGGGMAQGGVVHMAQGGIVGNQLRDRVPTLLEPGEFVIRKPAAQQIGVPALQSMNANGSGGMGNVSVNIINKGTPQEGQASQPRFDGEKFVIDVVTRDIANNGPIRKSLRG